MPALLPIRALSLVSALAVFAAGPSFAGPNDLAPTIDPKIAKKLKPELLPFDPGAVKPIDDDSGAGGWVKLCVEHVAYSMRGDRYVMNGVARGDDGSLNWYVIGSGATLVSRGDATSYTPFDVGAESDPRRFTAGNEPETAKMVMKAASERRWLNVYLEPRPSGGVIQSASRIYLTWAENEPCDTP